MVDRGSRISFDERTCFFLIVELLTLLFHPTVYVSISREYIGKLNSTAFSGTIRWPHHPISFRYKRLVFITSLSFRMNFPLPCTWSSACIDSLRTSRSLDERYHRAAPLTMGLISVHLSTQRGAFRNNA